MIDIDESPDMVEVWVTTGDGQWLLLTWGPDRLAVLVEAERLVRADLRALHELLHAAKQAERR